MLTRIAIESFKSLEKIDVELGLINVFVGANGSGKSNLLEAIGVLSAAANGRVDDEALMRRGVRRGSPELYNCALEGAEQTSNIVLSAQSEEATYTVSLSSRENKPSWRYSLESMPYKGGDLLAGFRSNGPAWIGNEDVTPAPRLKLNPNPEAGLAALVAGVLPEEHPALRLLDLLRAYAIYEPNTPTLRGLTPELQPREPVGLSGGGLPQAVQALLKPDRPGATEPERIAAFIELIDWAASVDSTPLQIHSLSPYTSSGGDVRFTDRFMKRGRNEISGADASEGALYILFAAVLVLDERAPRLLALDNADHGLNPRLAQALIRRICDAVLSAAKPQQLLLTSHSPQALDGLRLEDERVRLFTVSRTNKGRTVVQRVEMSPKLLNMLRNGSAISRLWVMGHLGGMPNV